MRCHPATLNKYSGEIKVLSLLVNGVSYLSGFKLHFPVEMRSCVRAWDDWEGGGFASRIGFDKLGDLWDL